MGTTVVANHLFTYDCNGMLQVWFTDKEMKPTWTRRTGDPEHFAQQEFVLYRKETYPPAIYSRISMKRYCSIAVNKNRYIYIPSGQDDMGNRITALDIKKLSREPMVPLWETEIIQAGTPAVYSGTIFIGNGPVTALNTRTGKILWVTELPKCPIKDNNGKYIIRLKSTPAVSEGWVYITSDSEDHEGYLFVLKAETGHIIDSYKLSKQWNGLQGYSYTHFEFRSSPVVVDGWVYVGSTDSCLYAFQGKEQ